MEYETVNHPPKRFIKRVRVRRLLFVAAIVYAAIMFASVVIRQESMLALQAEDMRTLEQQIQEIQAINAELERKLEFTGSDAYIESVARDQLGYVKEGEIKIVAQE